MTVQPYEPTGTVRYDDDNNDDDEQNMFEYPWKFMFFRQDPYNLYLATLLLLRAQLIRADTEQLRYTRTSHTYYRSVFCIYVYVNTCKCTYVNFFTCYMSLCYTIPQVSLCEAKGTKK